MRTHNIPLSFETAVVNQPSVFEPLKFCCKKLHEIIALAVIQHERIAK